MVETTSKVSKGDCPWIAAKKNLRAQGKKVTNSEIVKEMDRLAKANGCSSVDDFSAKFFNKVGLEYVTDNTKSNTPAVTKKKVNPEPAKNDSVTKPTKKVVKKPQSEVDKINGMKSDSARIVEYNKNHYQGKYYGIVDKKSCKLKIYDKSGKVVKEFTVGVGKKKGDDLSKYYQGMHDGKVSAAKAEEGRTTTPGEFTLDEYKTYGAKNYISKKDGKHKIMALKGDNRGEMSGQTAIHMIPNHRQERIAQMKSKTTADNRMSYGCVNLTEEDYDAMHKYLGEGDKIYILPEEKGNKLQLEKQTDGTYKFAQTKHKSDKRQYSAAVASRVNYDIRPDNNLALKEKKATQEKLLAQQKAKQKEQESKEFHLLKPSTWGNLFA